MGAKPISKFEIERIFEARRNGFSIREISELLNRSRASIAKLVAGVEVSDEHIGTWRSKRGGNSRRALAQWQQSELKAKKLLNDPKYSNILILAASLYWAEGNKKDFNFINSDPTMIQTFIYCLKMLGLIEDRLTISIRIYNGINKNNAVNYWSNICSIAKNKIVSIEILPGEKKGKLQFGMCRIRLKRGADYFKLLMSAVKLIGQQYAPIAQRTEPQTPKL